MPNYTPAEIATLVSQIDGLEAWRDLDPQGFADYVSTLQVEMNIMLTATAAALEAEYLAGLTGAVSEEATSKARDLANKEAKRITGQVTEAELNKIGDKIATALEEGKRPSDISRELTEIRGLDKNRARNYEKYKNFLEENGDPNIEAKLERRFQKLLRDRRETIARTEGRDATSTAREIEAQERGATFKVWQTVGDSRVSDMDQAAESQGPIDMDKAFANGATRPPSHPNCRCTVSYFKDKRLRAGAQERADARAAETAAAKDEAANG